MAIAVNDLLLRRVLYGISCRNYAAAAEAIPGAIGLVGVDGVPRVHSTKLRELQERDLSGRTLWVLDGKTFAEAMVVSLGIDGEQTVLGFVETDTENEQVLTRVPVPWSSGGCFPGASGDRRARGSGRPCGTPSATAPWCNLRENVVSYLAKREQPVWRQRLQRADNRPEYDEALAALQSLQHELEDRNQSAAGSLAEGLDDPDVASPRRVWRAGPVAERRRTAESINALERCAKVDHWQNSSQRQRWATALLEVYAMGYRHLPSFVRIEARVEDRHDVQSGVAESFLGMGLLLSNSRSFSGTTKP